MNVLDLFSGIGGFSLGLERAGMRTVAFCEYEPYCRKVLRKHWSNVLIYEDVRTLTAERLVKDGVPSIDIVAGGFPCQDISNAGKRVGIDGERSGLWAEYARIIGEVRPRYVIVENVAALLIRGLDRILGDLAPLGYDAEWHCISASAVGAEHPRDRIWIVAYPSSKRLEGVFYSGWGQYLQPASSSFWGNRRSVPEVYRKIDGFPKPVDELRALGNAVVPQISELIGRAILKYDLEAA
jgi:DNA (cytosine-5)-methyltransferase 1